LIQLLLSKVALRPQKRKKLNSEEECFCQPVGRVQSTVIISLKVNDERSKLCFLATKSKIKEGWDGSD
jgi:hypothetical protein